MGEKGQSLATSRLDITPVLVQGTTAGFQAFRWGSNRISEPERESCRVRPRDPDQPGHGTRDSKG